MTSLTVAWPETHTGGNPGSTGDRVAGDPALEAPLRGLPGSGGLCHQLLHAVPRPPRSRLSFRCQARPSAATTATKAGGQGRLRGSASLRLQNLAQHSTHCHQHVGLMLPQGSKVPAGPDRRPTPMQQLCRYIRGLVMDLTHLAL